MSKPFSQDLYDQNDLGAKSKIIDWLQTNGITAWENPDQYGIDLLGTGPRGNYQFEVEVKHNWSGPDFPFATVHFSARKDKFASDNPNNFFVMLNHEHTHALIVPGRALVSGKRVIKSTKYTQDEQFIEIPVAGCRLSRISD